MSRKPRIHYPGALYHVVVRGNAQQDIFYDDVDRCRFCFLLQEGTERFGHRIHAFQFLSNHVHFAIQVGDIPLSRVVQNFSFRYTQWINKRQNRVGHLFQGRYKARVVDADEYLLQLVRYIDLNAVRAGLVNHPTEYRWGSYAAYVGENEIPWVTTDWVLSMFGETADLARAVYRSFVMESIDDCEAEALNWEKGSGQFLGDDAFIERVLHESEEPSRPTRSVDDIVRVVCERCRVEEDDISASGNDRRLAAIRRIAAWAVREHGNESITVLAKRLNRDLSTLSRGATMVAATAKEDPALLRQLSDIREALS